MDKHCATIVIATCVRAARELGDVAGILEVGDEDIKIALATAVYDIMQNIVRPVQDAHLDLKGEIEVRLEKYGRAF